MNRKMFFSKLMFCFLVLMMGLTSCNSDLFSANSESTEASGLVKINFSISEYDLGEGRAVFAPKNISASDISKITLNGSLQNPDNELEEKYIKISFEVASYEDFKKQSFSVAPGKWNFEVSAFKKTDADFAEIASVKKQVELDSTVSSIKFDLEEPVSGNGDVSMNIDELPQKVARIRVEFYSSEDLKTKKLEKIERIEDYQFSCSHELSKGYYLAKILFYSEQEDSSYFCTKSVYFRISPNRTTEINLSYNEEDLNTPYTINYVLKGTGYTGVFADSSNVVSEFNKSSYVVLPTKDDFTTKAYKFEGWYENAEYTGDPIFGWNPGKITRDVTLYAKWSFSTITPGIVLEFPTSSEKPVTITHSVSAAPEFILSASIPASPNGDYELVVWHFDGGNCGSNMSISYGLSDYSDGTHELTVIACDSSGVLWYGTADIELKK
ncbi:MAG: InlB B-repeat-containing protein [Treponema sp.]|nr:InlB B-repeat-containing protein [Candidatus Treponema equifaecale]